MNLLYLFICSRLDGPQNIHTHACKGLFFYVLKYFNKTWDATMVHYNVWKKTNHTSTPLFLRDSLRSEIQNLGQWGNGSVSPLRKTMPDSNVKVSANLSKAITHILQVRLQVSNKSSTVDIMQFSDECMTCLKFTRAVTKAVT